MNKRNLFCKLLACAFLFGVCLSVSAQEEWDDSFIVKYQGQRPTISDFVTAILSQDELGELLGSVSEQWSLYRKGKKTPYGTFTVDEKNGYIRYTHKTDNEDGHYESVTEFCYWNMTDNRHKLVALNSNFTESGRYFFTEHSGPRFHMYDSQTRRMSGADMERLGLAYSVDDKYISVFHLPQVGKDIKLTLAPPYEMSDAPYKNAKYVWDGMKFHLEKEEQVQAQQTSEDYDVSLRIVDEQGEHPGYEAIVRLNGKTLQVLEAQVIDRPDEMEKFGNVFQKDVNFDGLDDLLICLGGQKVSDQTFMHYDAWLATSADGTVKFVRYKNFRGVTNAEVDTANKRILSHYLVRDGVTYNYTAHRWKNGMLMEDGQSWNEPKKLLIK